MNVEVCTVPPSPLDRPVQIAYAVADVEAAAHRFASTTGAGPFFVNRHIALASSRILGVAAPFEHSSAYGQWGDVMVELVEEHTPALVEPGSGVHHLAFIVPDLDAAIDRCGRMGWPEVLWAETAGGLTFAFCDARHDLGHLVELYPPDDRLVRFYAMVASAASGWDGTDAVRMIS